VGWFGWLSGRWLLHGLQIQNQYNMLQHQQRELQQEMERLQNEAETVETVKVFDERLFQPPFRLNFIPLDIILFGEYRWYMSKEDACKELSGDSPFDPNCPPQTPKKNNSSMDVPTCRKSLH